MMFFPRTIFRTAAAVAPLLFLASCAEVPVSHDSPENPARARKKNFGKLFGDDTLKFGGKARAGSETGGIGVNSYLWHAVLDTFSYMPLRTVDPFGGVILTDWYSPEGAVNERFKVDTVILSRQLRTDGLRITMFRQTKGKDGAWEDAPVDPSVSKELEEIVLVRARQLRIESE